MNRRIERMEKYRLRKQEEIEEFLNNVDVLHDNTDSIVHPSVSIKKETEKNYINYHIVKHPNCLVYSLSMEKKDYPFNIYYSKEFYKNDIPSKYLEMFEELEKHFI